jgi:hypothetical protein
MKEEDLQSAKRVMELAKQLSKPLEGESAYIATTAIVVILANIADNIGLSLEKSNEIFNRVAKDATGYLETVLRDKKQSE